MPSFTSVPFKTESGLSQVNGVAKFSSAGVVLEFEAKILGLISKGIKEVRISTGEIHDVKFKKGVFKRVAKIEIRTKSLAALAGLPNKKGKIILKLGNDDIERGRDAVDKLQRDMAEDAAAMPPQTPMRALFDGSEDETQELI